MSAPLASAPRLLHETLLSTTATHAERVAIRDGGTSYTYSELLKASQSLAYSMQNLGLRRGDRVAIYLQNSWRCCVAVYATMLSGGVLLVINPQTPHAKVDFLLQDSQARFLLTEDSLVGEHLAELDHNDDLTVVLGSSAANGTRAGQADFDACCKTGGKPAPAAAIPLDLAALIYTSGSTGQPKGVMLSHQNMVFTLGSVTEYLGIERDDKILNVLPLAYSYGLYQLLMSVATGATLVLERSFSFLAKVVDSLEAEEATVFPGVPTLFAGLVSYAEASGLTLPSVRLITNAAAALPEAFVEPLQRIFPNAALFKMYGMTECKRISYLEPALVPAKVGSVGKAIPGTEVFLVDENGQRVGPGGTGMLHVRGPHVMLGYWRQPELSAAVLKEGVYPGERVLVSGDYFRMDDEGFLYFLGRSDDIIKTRGEKVSPAEVEDVLFALAGVKEAAVVGVPDEVMGQTIKAFIVLEEGSTLSEREVRRACMARLESVMVPREVVFVAELPKTATGKVRKRSLREA